MTAQILLGILGGLGGSEILLIVLVLLLFFGGKKLPELARGLGKGIREFKDASAGVEKDEKKDEKSLDK
jgi:sec-independent protein translocase protein TatA